MASNKSAEEQPRREDMTQAQAQAPRWRLLPIDLAAGLFIGVGALMLYVAYGDVDYGVRGQVTVTSLVLLACGAGISITGHRRHRQAEQEAQETRSRGFAGRHLMPLGDQVATVISRCVVAAIISSIAAGALSSAILLNATVLRLPGGANMVISGTWLLALGSTLGVGWWTWRDLRAKNRKLAEPHCPECGYVLYGTLLHHGWGRCTECGREFTLTELNVNLVRLDEEGRLQPK